MRSRKGFSLIELLIVMAIAALLAAMVMGGVQRARQVSARITCTNNLRQLGAAMMSYESASGNLPFARSCPDVDNGNDPDCMTVTTIDYTGPNETWWAPYDNRPGTTPTQALPDQNFQHGPLAPLLENIVTAFQCPNGYDNTPGSPTYNQRYQISFAMNWVTNGPSGQPMNVISSNNGTTNVMLLWDHMNSPACAVLGWPRLSCTPYVNPQTTHYPLRHSKRYNVLFCDGRVASMIQTELQASMFVAY